MASGKRTSVVTDGPILVLINKCARNGTHDESCSETHEDQSHVPKPEPEGDFIAPHASGTTVEYQSDQSRVFKEEMLKPEEWWSLSDYEREKDQEPWQPHPFPDDYPGISRVIYSYDHDYDF